MAELKSYTCSKCAGVLMFDSDQEFFECPFCGTAFNVVDFHADELLEQANECLAQSDFKAAKDKYGKLFENEPDNYDALWGMILCEAKVPSVNGLKDPHFYYRCNLNSVRKAVDNAVRRSPAYAVPVFEKISELVKIAEEMKPITDQINVVESEITPESLALSRKITQDGLRPFKSSLIMSAGFYAVLAVMIIAYCARERAGVPFTLAMLFIVALGFGAVTAMIYFTDRSKFNKLTGAFQIVVKAKDDSDVAGLKEEKLKENYARVFAELMEIKVSSEAAVKEEKKSPVKASEVSVESAMDENSEKVIICDKCAARLSLNKEKRVYECGSCGVAYGVSLFFGMPLEKALNAINMGRYEDAEKRFSNLLMVNPADFDGLLGRILCTGKWNNVSSIGVSDSLRPITYKNLQVMADKAAESAGENDKEYFEKLKNLLALLEELYMIDYKEKAAERKLENLDIKDRVFSSEKYSTNAANYREKWQIQDDLKHNFNKIKEKLLGMRNSSALCK